ncbi:hypothetical protein PVL29_020574 [Vitis rotundifolia]|uniref:Uncharacterized protein n=1 Tax=Vitis rotundifolia TaxID=103349 RepID=A0AA38YXR1_VITRO|nr:hypothetical protein PVL29_020574 [Vitis rotundifolia]
MSSTYRYIERQACFIFLFFSSSFFLPFSFFTLSVNNNFTCHTAHVFMPLHTGTTQHLRVNCGTQRSDKVEHNYGSDKVENSHNSCYNGGETSKDERLSMATTSTRNGSLTS